MDSLSPSDLARARWIPPAVLTGDTLLVVMPMVLDGVNARVLRKKVISRLAECRHVVFDARDLNVLGRIGAATFWHIVSIAESIGVGIRLDHVAARIEEKLSSLKQADTKRRTYTHETNNQPMQLIRDQRASTQSGRHTIRMTRDETRVISNPAKAPRAKWSDRILKLLPNAIRRKDAA